MGHTHCHLLSKQAPPPPGLLGNRSARDPATVAPGKLVSADLSATVRTRIPPPPSALRLEEKLLLRIGAQVADALRYLHSLRPNPIVHRDLKPENLLWDQRWFFEVNGPQTP